MNAARLLVLQISLLAGLGAVTLVPRHPQILPSAVKLELPALIGAWEGQDQAISEKELAVLAHDTEFARKIYRNAFGDEIFASIVLSGHDLDNSIHRPERCLPAQGWTIQNAGVTTVPFSTAGKLQRLKVMRLHNMRPVKADNGEMKTIYNLNYYWFVGSKDLTASHLERTMFDIRDRVLFGNNQRWAYITVAATITEGLARFGRSEAEVDKMLREFIAQLFPLIIDSKAVGSAGST